MILCTDKKQFFYTLTSYGGKPFEMFRAKPLGMSPSEWNTGSVQILLTQTIMLEEMTGESKILYLHPKKLALQCGSLKDSVKKMQSAGSRKCRSTIVEKKFALYDFCTVMATNYLSASLPSHFSCDF